MEQDRFLRILPSLHVAENPLTEQTTQNYVIIWHFTQRNGKCDDQQHNYVLTNESLSGRSSYLSCIHEGEEA